MTLARALLFVIGTAIAFGVIGAVLGWGIGAFLPDAYRAWCTWGPDPSFSPIEFGIGIGLVQGLIAGLAVGVVLVAIVTWYRVRTKS